MGAVDQGGAPKHEGARSFGEAFLIHQRTADVGVHDQRVGGAVGVFCARDGAALQAVFGIGQRVLIGDIGLGQALHADAKARFVHHGEHCAHAFMGLAQQIAGGAVVIHDAGGIAMDAHFMFDLAAA